MVKSKPHSRPLLTSMRGFLFTCKPTQEALAAAEMRGYLHKYVPPKPVSDPDLRPQKLLKVVETGCKGAVFMKLNPGHPNYKEVEPMKVVADLFAAKERQLKHVAKVWPVLGSCNALDEAKVRTYFAQLLPLPPNTPVNLDFHSRNSRSLNKEQVTALLTQARIPLSSTPSSAVLSLHFNAV